MSHFRSFILLFGASSLALAIGGCSDNRKAIRDGDTLLANKEYSKAVERYEQAIKDFPGSKPTVDEASTRLRAAYLSWINDQLGAKNYGEAANTVRTFAERFPEDKSIQEKAFNLRWTAELENAKNLLEYETPADAAEIIGSIVEGAKDSAFAEEAAKLRNSFGHFLIEGTSDGKSGLWRVNSDGTALAFVVDGIQHRLSPDGTKIIFVRPREAGATLGSLHMLDLASGQTTELFNADVCTQPFWFPDSKSFVVTKVSDTNLFQVVKLSGEKENHYNQGFEVDGKPAFNVLGPVSADGGALIGWQLPEEGRAETRISSLRADFSSFAIIGKVPGSIRSLSIDPANKTILAVTDKAVMTRPIEGSAPFSTLYSGSDSGFRLGGYAVSPRTPHKALITSNEGDVFWEIQILDRSGQPSPLKIQKLDVHPGTLYWIPETLPQ